MAAALSEGETILQNCASEPHVQDICKMLVAMGAKITGIGSNILHITGVKKLHGCEFTIGPDYIEIGSYIGMAAATKGKITIKGVRAEEMRPLKYSFAKQTPGVKLADDLIADQPRVNEDLQVLERVFAAQTQMLRFPPVIRRRARI